MFSIPYSTNDRQLTRVIDGYRRFGSLHSLEASVRVFAVVPVLMVVLVSLCGSPVKPPATPSSAPTPTAAPTVAASTRATKIYVMPSSGPTGTLFTIRGSGFASGERYDAVLAYLGTATPRDIGLPPEGFPTSLQGGFPESSHARGNGCQLASATAAADGSFVVPATIPERCTTLDGDGATVLPGTYMIWDTTNAHPPRSAWFLVLQTASAGP